jgi:SAM-dependent methyltransferase
MSEGSAADSVVDLYRRHGRAWAALRGERLIEAAWLERFAALLPPDAAVLDLGCGPGVPIARWLASRGFRVTGIDAAPSMIELARTSLPAQTWHVADMRDLDLGQRFAGILAWDSFFHLDAAAQRAMFAVFAAHALVGAGLMFTSGPAAGTAIGDLFGEPLFHASLAGGEYRALLERHGFTVVAQQNEDPGCGGHTVWLARRDREAHPASP